jgi:hypothetical protein
MFRLTWEEIMDIRSQSSSASGESLRSQIVTLKRGTHIKYLPYAFTEHGALMAATVLNSPRAVAMSLAIINTFIKLRQLLSVNKDLTHRLDELEEKYDKRFHVVFQAIKQLMEKPEEPPKPRIGFHG